MNNLANTLRDQGDLPGARRLQEAVLEAMKRLLGDEHPDTLSAMGNLAIILWHQGEAAAARHLQQVAAAGRSHVLGAAHPDTAAALESLRQMQEGSAAPSNEDKRRVGSPGLLSRLAAFFRR